MVSEYYEPCQIALKPNKSGIRQLSILKNFTAKYSLQILFSFMTEVNMNDTEQQNLCHRTAMIHMKN